MMRAMLVLLVFCLLLISSEATSMIPIRPHALPSLKIHSTQNQGTCAFPVTIRTSCSSPWVTHDRVSLSFGDAGGTQVYAPRLDDPSSRAFERCSTDTFEITGRCTHQICYLYLYRSGYDGWAPYDVTVYGHNTNPVTFYYNVFLPSGKWYGFNHCGRAQHGDTATA